MRRSMIVTGAVAAVAVAAALIFVNNYSIFVIQPIGAVPEGRTVIVPRLDDYSFVESADAVCLRRTGSVNLLCRGVVLGGVAKGDILLRMPYSETLYLLSTGGRSYDR